MVRTTTLQERADRADAKGYILGACCAEDSNPDPVKYVSKTLIEQNRLLRYYEE